MSKKRGKFFQKILRANFGFKSYYNSELVNLNLKKWEDRFFRS